MGGEPNPMLWVGYPKSYSAGRSRAPQYVVMHYTAGSEGPTSAEAGADYDKNRADGTSCHAFFDSEGPGLQEVPFSDRSHSAYFHGNEIGIQYELCGTIQTRAQWLDANSYPMLVTAAKAVAYTCRTLGLEMRRLTTAEVRAAYYNAPGSRPTGICDHKNVTDAYPEDGGTHTDVGPEFPWDVFMQLVLEGEEKYKGDGMCFVAKSGAGMNGETIPGHTRWWCGDGVFHVEISEAEANTRISIMKLYGMPDAVILSWADSSPEAIQRNIGPIPAGASSSGGAAPLTYDQTVQAARDGAALAEDS